MSLGVHVKLDGFDRDLLPLIIDARPSIFVGTGDPKNLPIMRTLHDALGESCILVFRHFFKDDGPWENLKAAKASETMTAQATLDDVAAIGGKAYPYIHWQWSNEMKNDFAWIGVVDAKRAQLFLDQGLRVVGASCSRGVPEPNEIQNWLEFLKIANRHPKDVRLALHQYWTDDDLYTDYRYQLGRWKDWEKVCEANGLDHVMVNAVVTEFGAEPAWRAQGMSVSKLRDLLVAGDGIDFWLPKAIYDCSNISDWGAGQPHEYGIQENVEVGRGKDKEIIDPMRDFILPAIKVQAKPTTPPPASDPEPPSPPPAARNLIINSDFSGGFYSVAGNPDQQVVPNGWYCDDERTRVEIDIDPRFGGHVARIIEAYEKREIRLCQDVEVEVGATYRLTMVSAPWCVTDAHEKYSPSDSPGLVKLRVDSALYGELPALPGAEPDQFMTIIVDFKPLFPTATVKCGIKPDFAVERTDLRIRSVEMVKIADPTPQPDPVPAPGAYETNAECYIRATPNRQKAPAGELPASFPLPVTEFVVGEVIEGNKFWGKIGTFYVSAKLLRKV